ncbi:putative reverse transcriptase domain-containing protein [Tanacetum coccineum]
MDNLNLTMEEYIMLEEEKAQKCRKVCNWQTATYGKIRAVEDIHDLRSVETEFPAIDFNDEVSSKTLSYEPTVCSLNDEIDFRISFDESDDEDYTIICEKNSFSYKMISVNNLKTNSENDNEKIFLRIENEFPAIVYNDAQTSKSELLTEPTLNPQHIDEFNLNDETSMSEYDEEEQNILYFNDLFPFNIILPDDLKLEKDNDDNDIDITRSLLDNEIIHGSTMLFETSHDKSLVSFSIFGAVGNLHIANGKSKKHTDKPKAEDSIQEKLYLLHMDLCVRMRIQIINGRKYILVNVDDYPRTNNGTEFVNQTLRAYYEDAEISHQTSIAHTPQQNGVVERRNQTVETRRERVG